MTGKMIDRFLVPDWLIGSEREVLQALPSVAKVWASRYRASGSFPQPTLVDPGKLDVILYNSSDFQPDQPAVRLFANIELIWMIDKALQVSDNEELKTDYEIHVGAAPWGSFEAFLFLRAPDSLANLQRRYRQVLPHLTALAHRQVVTVGQQRVTALAALDQWIGRTLQNWGAPADGPLADRIELALDAMVNATPASIDGRIIRRILELAPVAPRVKHRGRFTPEFVRQWVTSLDPDEHLNLTGCEEGSLYSEIVEMDRSGGIPKS